MTVLVTGGARSGKSRFASLKALELDSRPTYIATARHWDDEFSRRIARHKADRNDQFDLIEIERDFNQLLYRQPKDYWSKRTVVVDCVTLWLTNYFSSEKEFEHILPVIKKDVDDLISLGAKNYIVITNELGMGMHPETHTGRSFQDVHGWLNQYIAQRSDEVYLLVSGIDLKIKG